MGMGLMEAKDGLLLVLDVQDESASLVEDTRGVIRNCAALAREAAALGIPVVVTEADPEKNGHIVFDIAQAAPGAVVLPGVGELGKIDKKQVVVAGIETHLSVLRTALELQAKGREVFVVADACSAGSAVEHVFALQRLAHAGVIVATAAMALAEWRR